MTMKQMVLFEKPVTEFDAMWEAINSLKLSHEKVRKRLFRELKDLEEEIVKVRSENERIKFHTKTTPSLTWSG